MVGFGRNVEFTLVCVHVRPSARPLLIERKKIRSLVSDAIAHNFTDYAPRHATIAAQPVTLGRLSSDFEPSITPAREPRLASEPRST